MKRTAILVSILILIIVAAGGSFLWYRNSRGSQVLSRARLALKANNPAKVRSLMDRYLARQGDDWQGRYMVAQSYRLEGDYERAHAALDLAEKASPDRAAIALLRADLLNREAQKSTGEREFSDLQRTIEYVSKAIDVLKSVEGEPEKRALQLKTRLGMNYRRLAGTFGAMAKELGKQAAAEAARKPDRWLENEWAAALGLVDADRRRLVTEMAREALGYAPATVDRTADQRRRVIETLGALLASSADDNVFTHQALVAAARMAIVDAMAAVGDDPTLLTLEGLAPSVAFCERVLAPGANPRHSKALALRSVLAKRQDTVSLIMAKDVLLAVVRQAPTEAEAAVEAVDLCLGFRDRRALMEVREALEPLAGAPLTAALMLLEDDVWIASQRHAPGRAYRDMIAETCVTLAELSERNPDAIRVKLMQADLAMQLADYDQVQRLAGSITESDPPSWARNHIRLLLAERKLAVEGPEAAESDLYKLTTEFPNSPEAHYAYARAVLAIGKESEAAQELNALTQLGSRKPLSTFVSRQGNAILGLRIKLNHAKLALLLDRPDSAISLCEDIRRAAPGHSEAWLIRAAAVWRSRSESAVALMSFVLAANGTDYQEQAQEAIASFQQSIDVQRQTADALFAEAAAQSKAIGAATLTEVAKMAAADRQEPGKLQAARNAVGAWRKAIAAQGRVLQMFRSTYACWAATGDADKAGAVVEMMAGLPRWVGEDRILLAGALRNVGAFDGAEKVLRDELAAHGDVPSGRIRLTLAGLLSGRDRLDEAAAMFDAVAADERLRAGALSSKMGVLARAGRTEEAAAVAAVLFAEAAGKTEAAALLSVASFHIQNDQAPAALAAAERLVRLVPTNAGIVEPTLMLLHRITPRSRAIAMCKSVLPSLEAGAAAAAGHKTLSNLLDAEGDRPGALAAMTDLRNLSGAAGDVQMHRAEALFHEAELFTRWGLHEQAVAKYKRLAVGEQQGGPRGILALGRSLAVLGQKAEAARVLRSIPMRASEYLAAQLELVELARTPEAQVAALRRIAQVHPTDESILLREMSLLGEIDRPAEAIEAYRGFVLSQGDLYRPATAAPQLAVQLLWTHGDESAAAAEAVRLAESTEAQSWRIVAALLLMDAEPARAEAMLETAWAARVDAATPVTGDALGIMVGIVRAASSDDAASLAKWVERYAQLEQKVGGSGAASLGRPSDRLLAAIAAGDADQAAELLKQISDVRGFGLGPAANLASAAADPGARAVAGDLLAASVAEAIRMPWLARSIAVKALTRRPTCQWAAAMALQTRIAYESVEARRASQQEVLAMLEPAECIVGRLGRAFALVEQGNDLEAAKLFAAAAGDGPENVASRMEQAMALERAGLIAEAMAVYETLWRDNPVAANNLAYLMLRMYPDDPEKLALAAERAVSAVNSVNDAAFRDTLGWIAFRQGKYAEAVEHLTVAVRRVRRDAVVHYHVGAAEAMIGHPRLARWHFEAAVSLGDAAIEKGQTLADDAAEALAEAQRQLAAMGPGE